MMCECSIPVREIPIATLGPAKIPSPLPYGGMLDTGNVLLSVNNEYDEDLGEPQTLQLEEAGPRRDLYFDPGKTKCAIVTCGGLCPGLNDVIRAIVLEAYHAYKTPSVLGIRYGLEGFIPSCNHNVMELTPASVEHIYQFGGTLLGSSRGPQDPAEIVDALERLNVSVLFVIGGDGSMKAASAIAKEVRRRNIRISVIGIPKTIDNDINFVPQSFGFDTAVDKATEAIGCAHVEAVGTPNGIGIVKLMGRESGFIAAQAALALRERGQLHPHPRSAFQLYGGRRASARAGSPAAAARPRRNHRRRGARDRTSSSATKPATPPATRCWPTWAACSKTPFPNTCATRCRSASNTSIRATSSAPFRPTPTTGCTAAFWASTPSTRRWRAGPKWSSPRSWTTMSISRWNSSPRNAASSTSAPVCGAPCSNRPDRAN